MSSSSLGASISLGVSGASVGASLTWEKTKESKDASQAVIAGTISASRGYGDADSANWVLRRVQLPRPVFHHDFKLRCSLERDRQDPDEQFLADVEVKEEMDFKMEIVSSIMGLYSGNHVGKLDEIDLNDLINISSVDAAWKG